MSTTGALQLVMKSVEGTLHILELIAEHQPISLTKLCELIDRPTPSIQRGVKTLKDFGWIKPESVIGNPQWVLSNRFLSLTAKDHMVSQLSHIAKPYLIEIRDLCNEATFLTTFDLYQVSVIDFLDSTHAVRLVGGTGGNIPTHISSTGRACLALLTGAEIDKVIQAAEKKDHSLNLSKVKISLPTIKKRGYCIVEGEWSPELTQVGCAITDKNNYPLAGLGVSIPSHRYKEIDKDALASALRVACSEISAKLKDCF